MKAKAASLVMANPPHSSPINETPTGCELIAIGDSDSTEEALDDTEHNALCLEQISKGLAMLTEILDRATLTAAA